MLLLLVMMLWYLGICLFVKVPSLHGAHGDEGFDGLALGSGAANAGRCYIKRCSGRKSRVHDVIAAGCRRNSKAVLEDRRRIAPLG